MKDCAARSIIPLCNVAVGSFAADFFHARADQCPLRPESDRQARHRTSNRAPTICPRIASSLPTRSPKVMAPSRGMRPAFFSSLVDDFSVTGLPIQRCGPLRMRVPFPASR